METLRNNLQAEGRGFEPLSSHLMIKPLPQVTAFFISDISPARTPLNFLRRQLATLEN